VAASTGRLILPLHKAAQWIRCEDKEQAARLKRRLHVHSIIVLSAGIIVVCSGFALIDPGVALFIALLADGTRELVDYIGGW